MDVYMWAIDVECTCNTDHDFWGRCIKLPLNGNSRQWGLEITKKSGNYKTESNQSWMFWDYWEIDQVSKRCRPEE